ncbi:MAG TPA: PDZ domain-containing protein [Gemmataceae bacterium]|jgi:S1-C subfamily serine protease|nr:PDZ domain-containing protein [Gemmataceae bacterium]
MKSICFSVLALGFGLLAVTAVRADDEPGYIGVQIKATPDNDGVIIVMILKDSPAHEAELQADDVVKKIDGKDVTTVRGFVDSIRETKPGTKIKLTVLRNGQEKEIEVKVGKKSDDK